MDAAEIAKIATLDIRFMGDLLVAFPLVAEQQSCQRGRAYVYFEEEPGRQSAAKLFTARQLLMQRC